jgi:hypothetical protein
MLKTMLRLGIGRFLGCDSNPVACVLEKLLVCCSPDQELTA